MFRTLTLGAVLALTASLGMAADIKVGVTPGEHAEIMEEVARLAAPKGLNIEVIEFSDYVVPNQAMDHGDLDVNSFQHQPYLDNRVKDDPTDGGRARLLLQDPGLIAVDADAGLVPSPLDVTDNPKGLKFLELDAAQLPHALADADVAINNTNFALAAGLNPKADSIAMEKPDSPYANIIVVKKGDESAECLPMLIETCHSGDIKKFIGDKHEGAVMTAW